MKRLLMLALPALLSAACASTVADRAVQPAGVDVLALVAQAHIRLEAGEISEGLRLFRRAVALDPANQELAEEYGIALAELGLGEQAMQQLQRVQGLGPAGEAALGLLLAQSAQDLPQLESAVLHLTRGLDSPQGPQARLALVQSLLRLRRGEEAWEALRPALAERPDEPRLLLLAGQALRVAGRQEEAIEHLRRAAADPEGRQRAVLELVETLASAGRYKDAAEELGGFLQREGASLAGLTRWATLLARSGDTEKARSVLDEVLAKEPTFREALLLRALVIASDGDIEGAEAAYRRALAAHPDDADALLGLARLLVEVRRLDEARALLDGLWKQLEKASPAAPAALVEVAQERGTLELVDRKPEAARVWLERMARGPLDRRSLALWAEYFRLREAFADGLAWLEKANLSEAEEMTRLRTSIEAEFRFALGDEPAARATLAPLLAGREVDVLAAIGALERRKMFAEIVPLAREALTRFENAPDIEFALAASLERSGAWEESVPVFRGLIERYPDNPAGLNYLGYLFADKGIHLEEAREMLIRAVKLDPTSGAYLDSLGWVYFRLGQLDEAERYLTEAARLEPFDPTVQEHLGDLFKARGDAARAASAYRQALANKPDEEGQHERIEAKLAELTTHERP